MKNRTIWSLAISFILSLAWLTLPLGADELLSAPAPSIEPVPADQLSSLADAGQFSRLLLSLKATDPGRAGPELTSLIRDLEHYQAHRSEQSAKQQEAYSKAYETMNKQARAGKLEEAIFSALLARDLSTDKASFLRDEKVADLIKQVEAVARQAQDGGDWVEALSLYRSLDDLFDDYATFHKQVKTAAKHLRLLRLYAPEVLQKLLQQRADRLIKNRQAEKEQEAKEQSKDAKEVKEVKDAADKPKEKEKKNEEIHLDKETWQQKLSDIDVNMMKQSLSQAAQRHVASRSYATLLKGAAEAMITLADTQAVVAAFPSFADAHKVQSFRSQMVEVMQDIDNRAGGMGLFDPASLLDRMIAINTKTLNLPEEVIVYEMTEGAIDTLDEFSAVIWPHDKEGFSRNFQGKFYGVGIQISQRDDRLIVVSPLEATPAMRAGIKAGDIIAKVNGQETAGWSLDQAVREITGEEGTKVILGIDRPGVATPLEFTLTRAEIPIESIRGWQHRPAGGWDYYIDPVNKIGYVRLSQFIPQSADDLDAAINQMEKEGGLNALILDLRFDPGGLLSAAVEVVNRFVPSGTIVSTVGPADTRTSQFSARPERAHSPLPLVVLVNQGSASASEIVSGALQDYRKALIVGTRSFGKGSVQDVFPIDKGKAYLKLTTQYYKLPKGRIIHRKPEDRTWGVEPDLKITMTSDQIASAIEFRQKADVLHRPGEPEDPKNPTPQANEILEKSLDPQLEAALLVLKTRLVANHIALAQGRN